MSTMNELEENRKLNEELKNIINLVDADYKNNPRVQELEEQLKENKLTYFDHLTDERFRAYYADEGDQSMYDPKLYEAYKDDIENFDKNIEKLYIEKTRIESRPFFIGKKKKLEDIKEKIRQAQLDHYYFMDIYKDEMRFKKLWFRDGKFVDLNKECNTKLEEIKTNYLKEYITKFFNENPKFSNLDYSKFKLPENMINAIKDLQNKSEEKNTTAQNNFKDNVNFNNKNESGNDDGGAGSAGFVVIDYDEDKEKGNGGNAPSSNSQSILVEDKKDDKKKENEEEQEREM